MRVQFTTHRESHCRTKRGRGRSLYRRVSVQQISTLLLEKAERVAERDRNREQRDGLSPNETRLSPICSSDHIGFLSPRRPTATFFRSVSNKSCLPGVHSAFMAALRSVSRSNGWFNLGWEISTLKDLFCAWTCSKSCHSTQTCQRTEFDLRSLWIWPEV